MATRAHSSVPLSPASRDAARAAGLRYVDDRGPGIERRRSGRGFRYFGPNHATIRNRRALARIKSLAIPPAWTDVWICPSPSGHIQAVGWDARGRKQYRYHKLYRAVRDRTKFDRMQAFGAVLSKIRARVSRDLQRSQLPREKVLAAVVRLLETTAIRVGNSEYARANHSFGLTTLRNRHLRSEGRVLRFEFNGKSGIHHSIRLEDHKVACIVRRCHELPGHRLLQYLGADGRPCNVDSGDVNRYLREITGQDFTAKDFRTWVGTVLAFRELVAVGPHRGRKDEKSRIAQAVTRVAEQLGNRPATCRKYYIHPRIISAYSDGSLFDAVRPRRVHARSANGLRAEEHIVLALISKYPGKAESARGPGKIARRPRTLAA
ncbi:MAG TPA: hypothetical protein VJN43_18860 [Bryobacteraceae bacterium]|nr:hypothetical protein [Bryobacteraceae bacterium]